MEGGDGVDNLIGGLGDDLLTDLNGDDTLKGGDGDDTLSSGQGFGGDLNQGGRGNDFIIGGNDMTETFAGAGNDFVYAGDAEDAVFGDDGDDWIETGRGPFLLHLLVRVPYCPRGGGVHRPPAERPVPTGQTLLNVTVAFGVLVIGHGRRAGRQRRTMIRATSASPTCCSDCCRSGASVARGSSPSASSRSRTC